VRCVFNALALGDARVKGILAYVANGQLTSLVDIVYDQARDCQRSEYDDDRVGEG
jgi:hypothetical protein